MQLVEPEAARPDQKSWQPSLYAALIDSLFQNSWPDARRLALRGHCRRDDGAEDRQRPALAVRRAPDRRHRRRRARSQMRNIRAAHFDADARRRPSIGKPRYAIGAMVYAGALGVWCIVTMLGSDDAVAHMICVAVTIGYTAGGAARNYGRPWIIQCPYRCSRADRLSRGAGAARRILLCRAGACCSCCSSSALKQINLSLHAIFVQGADVELPRSGARQPVRHRAEQHAARPVHVPRRRASCGDEPSLQRDDGAVRRSGASRRHRADIVTACVVAGSISAASGKIILAEIENSHAGDIITTDPDVRPRPFAVMDVPADGRRRRRRAARGHHRAPQRRGADQPSGAL